MEHIFIELMENRFFFPYLNSFNKRGYLIETEIQLKKAESIIVWQTLLNLFYLSLLFFDVFTFVLFIIFATCTPYFIGKKFIYSLSPYKQKLEIDLQKTFERKEPKRFIFVYSFLMILFIFLLFSVLYIFNRPSSPFDRSLALGLSIFSIIFITPPIIFFGFRLLKVIKK